MTRELPALDTLRGALAGNAGGKRELASALARLEAAPDDPRSIDLLSAAYGAPPGVEARVVGLTGPPGVGKSTLAAALMHAWRAQGRTVGIVAVDPSSRTSGGALLGDRTRFDIDPEDAGVFARSMAARDRLGGLAEVTYPAVVLMRALFDVVLVESVGVGQSEAAIAHVADTVILCLQPGSGDSLQYMKAGIVEVPDILTVNKADLVTLAERTRADGTGGRLARRGGARAPWPGWFGPGGRHWPGPRCLALRALRRYPRRTGTIGKGRPCGSTTIASSAGSWRGPSPASSCGRTSEPWPSWTSIRAIPATPSPSPRITTAQTAQRVARAVETALSPDGINLVQANGPGAGQSVFHFHIHILPRGAGDDLKLNWGHRPGDMDAIKAVFEKVKAAIY